MAESLGRAVAARFQPHHVRRTSRVAPERRAGMVAAKAARFGVLNGRSIAARRMMGQSVSARVSGTEVLPVGMQVDLWMAVAERQRLRPTPSPMEQNLQRAHQRALGRTAPHGFAAQAAAAGPRGLPRVTSRGRLSPAGTDTGPAAASHRMVTEAAFVANPEEVRAAGPMLGSRDRARAVSRRSSIGPPSPSTGGGRARRTAQVSGPGRQNGATRPMTPEPTRVDAAPDAPAAELALPRAVSLPALSPTALAPLLAPQLAPPAASGSGVDPHTISRSAVPRPAGSPVVAGVDGDPAPSSEWQRLPRPGAVARRSALAATLRRMPGVVTAAHAEARPATTSMLSPVAGSPRLLGAAGPAAVAGVARMAGPEGGALPGEQAESALSAVTSTARRASTAVAAATAAPAARRTPTAAAARQLPVSLLGPATPAPLARGRMLAPARADHVLHRASAPVAPGARPSGTPPVVDRSRPRGALRTSIARPSVFAPRTLAATAPPHPGATVTDATQAATALRRSIERGSGVASPAMQVPPAPSVSGTAPFRSIAATAQRLAASSPAVAAAAESSVARVQASEGRMLQRATAPAGATAMPAGPPPSAAGPQHGAAPGLRRALNGDAVTTTPRLAAPVPGLPLVSGFSPTTVVRAAQPMLPIIARSQARAAAQSMPSPAIVRRLDVAASAAPSITPPATAMSSPPLSSIERSASPTVATAAAPAMARSTVSSPASTTELRRAIRPAVMAPAAAAPASAPLANTVVASPVPALAPSSAGARFITALNEQPADPLRPVPLPFVPLARAIAGPRRVGVRTGPSTSRALRRAGKRAATVGNVVHLDAPPSVSPRAAEVFAHELVHAARPSPVPRFFDDDHHSDEEDLARATGNLVRAVTSPTVAGPGVGSIRRSTDDRALTFGTSGLAVGAGGGLMSALTGAAGQSAPPVPPAAASTDSSTTIRRSVAPRPASERRSARKADRSSSSSPDHGSTGSGAVIRRSLSPSGGAGATSSIFGASSATIIRRTETGDPNAAAGAPDSNPLEQALGRMVSGITEANFRGALTASTGPIRSELIAQIVDAIEDRVIAELERRGRRHNPGVF